MVQQIHKCSREPTTSDMIAERIQLPATQCQSQRQACSQRRTERERFVAHGQQHVAVHAEPELCEKAGVVFLAAIAMHVLRILVQRLQTERSATEQQSSRHSPPSHETALRKRKTK